MADITAEALKEFLDELQTKVEDQPSETTSMLYS